MPSACFSTLVRHRPRHKRAEVRRALAAVVRVVSPMLAWWRCEASSPLSREPLRGQGVALFGRTVARLPPTCMLPCAQHVSQLKAAEGGLRSVERLAPQHRPGDPLYGSMVLLHDSVEISQLL